MKLPTLTTALRWLTHSSAGLAVLAAVLAIGLFLGGRLSAPRGLSPTDAADLVRRSGDSAVASYRRNVGALVPQLQDSVRYYRSKAAAAVRIVVRHDTVTVHDTAAVIVASADSSAGVVHFRDTTVVGLAIRESLTVAPLPRRAERHLSVAAEPDTVLAALLQLPGGLERFTAFAAGHGVSAQVTNAAAVAPRQGPGVVSQAVSVASLASCVLAGVELGGGHGGAVVYASGSGCLLGALRTLAHH